MNDCLQHTRVRSILSLVIPNPFCCQQHHWFPEGLQYLSLVLLNFCHIFATRADAVASRTKGGGFIITAYDFSLTIFQIGHSGLESCIVIRKALAAR